MWMIENHTPFSAERSWTRDQSGAEVWLVAIKGTFDIDKKGDVMLADDQMPVLLAPEYADTACSELIYDSDMMPFKRATDVVIKGSAYAPNARASRQWTVGLNLGAIKKELLISGPRQWQNGPLGMTLSKPEAITELALSYRHSYGGHAAESTVSDPVFFPANPIGTGYARQGKSLVGGFAPSIEYLDNRISHWRQRPRPAGFAAIPCHWMPRRHYAGTYDKQWENQRQPLLPDDFDDRFYQYAPEDQQVAGFLKGGEAVQLTNMTLSGCWRFYLPKAAFHIVTTFSDGHRAMHLAQLHTVIIAPEQQQLMMVWHSHLTCHARANRLESTSIRLKQRLTSGRKPPFWIGGDQHAT